MEAKYKIGGEVEITRHGRVLKVEILGHFRGQKEIIYSVRTEEGFIILIGESDIIVRHNV
jgi:hypothetical protein